MLHNAMVTVFINIKAYILHNRSLFNVIMDLDTVENLSAWALYSFEAPSMVINQRPLKQLVQSFNYFFLHAIYAAK